MTDKLADTTKILSIDELAAWAKKYASTPWNMLALATATSRDAAPMQVMRSLFAHVDRLQKELNDTSS